MEDTAQRPADDPATSAFAGALERWAALLQTVINARPGSPDLQQTLRSQCAGFTAELEAWLRTAHPFARPHFGVPGQSATTGAAPNMGGPFMPEMRQLSDLLGKWAQLQSQLTGHWSTVARAATEKFVAQVALLAGDGGLSDPRKLFARWIDCAEEAYAETAHSEAFGLLVADVVNTAVALQLEVRRCAQEWTRAADIPTRQEIDALTHRIALLERQVHRQAKPRSSSKPRGKGKRRL
jgi:truncated hemoglobin YjbI